MATKAKKKAPPANTAAPVDQSCPAEGMEHPPHKGPNPKVKGSPAPYLMVDGAIKAAEFYKRAFGAEQVACVPPDDKGRTMHVHLYINGGTVMLSDAYPEHGHPWKEPQGFNLHLQVACVPPDDKGRTMHVHLYINGGTVTLHAGAAHVLGRPLWPAARSVWHRLGHCHDAEEVSAPHLSPPLKWKRVAAPGRETGAATRT